MSQNFGLALRGVSNEYLKFGSIMLVPADKPTSSEHCYSTIIRVLIQPLSWPPHVNYGNYGKCTTKNVTFESVLFPQVTDLPHPCFLSCHHSYLDQISICSVVFLTGQKFIQENCAKNGFPKTKNVRRFYRVTSNFKISGGEGLSIMSLRIVTALHQKELKSSHSFF